MILVVIVVTVGCHLTIQVVHHIVVHLVLVARQLALLHLAYGVQCLAVGTSLGILVGLAHQAGIEQVVTLQFTSQLYTAVYTGQGGVVVQRPVFLKHVVPGIEAVQHIHISAPRQGIVYALLLGA